MHLWVDSEDFKDDMEHQSSSAGPGPISYSSRRLSVGWTDKVWGLWKVTTGFWAETSQIWQITSSV